MEYSIINRFWVNIIFIYNNYLSRGMHLGIFLVPAKLSMFIEYLACVIVKVLFSLLVTVVCVLKFVDRPSSLLFGISGTLLSMILRLELYSSGHRIISTENQNFYNLTFTLHGLLMIFFLVMPGLYGGFGNYFVPIFLGAPEVAFPRINSFSFLLLWVSYGLIILSMISEFPGGAGWTLYPPLSTSLMTLSPVTIDLIIDGLLVSGISSFLSSLNFMGTISNLRLSGLVLAYIPLFTWGIIITALLLLLTLPILTGALGVVLGDLHFNTIYFDSGFGGDPVLYQHFFWFFGHPEVYILIIPAFGIISQVISNMSEKVVFGTQSMVLAMTCISILGSIVWGHHIYTLGFMLTPFFSNHEALFVPDATELTYAILSRKFIFGIACLPSVIIHRFCYWFLLLFYGSLYHSRLFLKPFVH